MKNKKRAIKQVIKPPKPASLLQKIASQRNWLKWFICKDIHIGYCNDLLLVSSTQTQVDKVNAEMQKLRGMIDRDWKTHSKYLKAERKRFEASS